MEQFQYLFTPIKIGPITLRNRIGISSHATLFGDANLEYGRPGFYGERYAYYLAERAKGGVGLITFGQAAVHPTTAYELINSSVAYDERAIPGFRMATDMIHEHGAKVFIQLFHSGIYNSGAVSKLPLWGPSAMAYYPSVISSGEVAKEMEEEDIEELKNYYSISAKNAKAGGFDGIELHATHRYLLQQFLSPLFNRRNDKYGGSLENRMRLLVEVCDRVRDAIGNDMALGLRLPGDELKPGGLTLEDMKVVAKKFEATGKVDYLHISTGGHQPNLTIASMYFPHCFLTHLAAGIREAVEIPVFTVGRIVDPIEAENVLANGQADVVMMTRAHIADPELANKAREGRLDEIRPCLGDCQCCVGHVTRKLPVGCVHNPSVGKEKVWGIGTIKRTERKKKVMVVGGGPAGMEVAWVAAARGHELTLYEKEGELGGQINLAFKLPGRDEMEGVTRWRKTMLKKYDVKVVLNTEVTAELVEREKPDAVIVATGSTPSKDGFSPYTFSMIPGWEQDYVVTVEDVLKRKVSVGQNVLVYDIDSHIKAPGIAELLAEQGRKVQLVFVGVSLGNKLEAGEAMTVCQRLLDRGVTIVPNTLIRTITDHTVQGIDAFTGKTKTTFENVDTVVMVGANKANNQLYKALKGKISELHVLGDALAPRTVAAAVYDGHRAGRLL